MPNSLGMGQSLPDLEFKLVLPILYLEEVLPTNGLRELMYRIID
jgi:hypothetical protein